MFKILLKYTDNSVLQPVRNGWFPLYAAAWYGNASILKFMLDNNLGIETINLIGPHSHFTPLMAAIAQQNTRCVELICKCDETQLNIIGSKNRDTNSKANKTNGDTLKFAVLCKNGQALKILLRTLLQRQNVSNLQSFQNLVSKNILLHLRKNHKHLKIANVNRNDIATGNITLKAKVVLDFLIENYGNYNKICLYLRHGIYEAMLKGNVPSLTVTTPFYTNSNDDKMQEIRNSDNSSFIDRWRICDLLGAGAFGCVVKGVDEKNGKQVALKFISTKMNNETKRIQIIAFITNEIDTIRSINHENVIKLMGYNLNIDNNGTVLLAFEYAPYGELYQFLAITKYFNQNIAKTYLQQMLNALEACHNMDIMHRDLKPQNILLDFKYQIKIADFGLSTFNYDKKNKNTLFVGTRGFMSPEIASPIVVDYDDHDNAIYREVTPSCDVFSLGVILWQMLSHISVFNE